MVKAIPRTNPLKGGEYRKDSSAYYRSKSGTYRDRNKGLIVRAERNASPERLKKLFGMEARKSRPGYEGTLNTISGLDSQSRRVRAEQGIGKRERSLISNLRKSRATRR